MPIDVSSMSAKALDALIRDAQKEKRRKEKRKSAAAVRRAIEKAARAAGFTVEEVFGSWGAGAPTGRATPRKVAGRKPKSAPRRVAAKFRNPADATQTWTGRGNQPRWLAAALKDGATLESFRIEAPLA